jgi:hypothetical protein
MDATLPLDETRVEALERIVVERAIQACNGRVARASKLIGQAVPTIYRKLDKWKKFDLKPRVTALYALLNHCSASRRVEVNASASKEHPLHVEKAAQ